MEAQHTAQVFASGLAMGESPRWFPDGHMWVSDWGAQEILAFGPDGSRELKFALPFGLPVCFDRTPDGRVLIVEGQQGKLWRGLTDGRLELVADLRAFGEGFFNEIVVDARGHAYVNGAPGIVRVSAGGEAQLVASPLDFPNGMVLTPDGRRLIVAESHGGRLTAFDIGADGSLSGRRTWADLPGAAPDGICLDAEGAVWYADVPNRQCVRVREGGELLDTIQLDRSGFACALGGADGRTLFVVANEWQGMDRMADVARARTGQVLTARVAVPGITGPGARVS